MLAEAVLGAGDRVRVEAAMTEQARADGYRGARVERRLAPPIVIRARWAWLC